jgi:hypothetical protein
MNSLHLCSYYLIRASANTQQRQSGEGDLEKLLWLSVAGSFGVNSTESEGEQTGIIREQIRTDPQPRKFARFPDPLRGSRSRIHQQAGRENPVRAP